MSSPLDSAVLVVAFIFDSAIIAAAALFKATRPMLTLKPSGLGQPDDWTVLDDGREIGRIMWSRSAPAGAPWFWTITGRGPSSTADRGYAATLQDAKGAFRAAWERC